LRTKCNFYIYIYTYTLGPLALTHSLCSHKLCTFCRRRRRRMALMQRGVVTTKYGTQKQTWFHTLQNRSKFLRIHKASDTITYSHVPPKQISVFAPFHVKSWDPFQHLIISFHIYIYILVWLVQLAQVWTHYKIGKLNMWTLFCNACIHFFEQPNMKDKPSSVTTFSTDLKLNISPTFWIQIWPNKFH
jgi:hypothetical protein